MMERLDYFITEGKCSRHVGMSDVNGNEARPRTGYESGSGSLLGM